MTKVLDDLKAKIERIEGRTKHFSSVDAAREQNWLLGLDMIDQALPLIQATGGVDQSGIAFDACHDFTPLTKTDVPHVAGFIGSLLQRLPVERLRNGPVVWCQTAYNAREYGRIYPPSLMGRQLSPERVLFVNVPKERDLALVLEECVRVSRVAAVIGEGPAPDFTASRRLTLAAQESHVPCLILNTGGDISASAATTRWRVCPIAGPPDARDPQGPGHPAWSITLARSRGADASLNPTLAKPMEVFWNHETHSFNLVSAFRAGTSLARQTPRNTL